MQRVAVKKMLADWERQFPGRTETIFSAIRNVEVAHLADPRRFDFAGLEAARARSRPVAMPLRGAADAARWRLSAAGPAHGACRSRIRTG